MVDEIHCILFAVGPGIGSHHGFVLFLLYIELLRTFVVGRDKRRQFDAAACIAGLDLLLEGAGLPLFRVLVGGGPRLLQMRQGL